MLYAACHLEERREGQGREQEQEDGFLRQQVSRATEKINHRENGFLFLFDSIESPVLGKLAALRAVERITHLQLHCLGGLIMSLGLVRRLHRGVERRRHRRGLGVSSCAARPIA